MGSSECKCCMREPHRNLLLEAEDGQQSKKNIDFDDTLPKGDQICYCTDVEGHWDYFVNFVYRSRGLRFKTSGNHRQANSLDNVELELLDGWTFVFGGDSCDKGPGTLRFLRSVTDLKDKYPSRVFLIMGNRDINKMRWTSELHQSEIDRFEEVPPGYWVPEKARMSVKAYIGKLATAAAEDLALENITPEQLQKHNTKANRMRYFLKHDMGSDGEFEFRRQELAILRGVCASRAMIDVSDEEVVRSYEESMAPGGLMRKFIENAQLGLLLGSTIFVHGQIIGNQFFNCDTTSWTVGMVPNHASFIPDVKTWLVELNRWGKEQVEDWKARPLWRVPPTGSSAEDWRKRGGADIIEYGTPATRWPSVVYCRYLSESSMPIQYPQRLVEHLVLNGIRRVVVGHTPHGNAPTVIQHLGLTVIMADTSFSHSNSNLAFEGDNRGDAVSAVYIDNHQNCLQVSGQLQKPCNSSEQRLVDYRVMPLGFGAQADGVCPDFFVGREDGQINDCAGPDKESYKKFFVKAKLPATLGRPEEKYLLCNVDGYKVSYYEYTPEEVEEYLGPHLAGVVKRAKSFDSPTRHVSDTQVFGHDTLEWGLESQTVSYLFKKLDFDGDGVVTSQELHGACADQLVRTMLCQAFPNMNLEQVMDALDENCDGTVTEEEFSRCLAKYTEAGVG